MSWTQKPYCALDDVKAALGDSTTSADDFITSQIVRAQAWIDERLGFSFQTEGSTSTPATRTYNGSGRDQLLIDRCVALATVVVRTYVVATSNTGLMTRTFTDVDITPDVVLGPENRSPGFLLERYSPGNVFDQGRRNIIVTGTFGYDSIPTGITRACERLASHYVLEREAGYQDKVSGGTSGYGVKTFRTDVPTEVCEAVDRHRHRNFHS